MAELPSRNQTQLPSGTVTDKGTSQGTTGGTQQTGGTTSSVGSSAQQNMTPQALAALQGLIAQLSDHPAISDAAAELQLQASGLKPPSEQQHQNSGYGNASGYPALPTYRDERGNVIGTAAEFAAAQKRYDAQKQQIITGGGTVAGGTEETRRQQAQRQTLITQLATEHAANVANTAAANTSNAALQAKIITAYGDSVAKAASTYDANKGIVENANAVNRTQNDAAFQTYLKNTVTAQEDHQRAVEQNAQDRAITEQNLKRSQGLQDTALAYNREVAGQFSKQAAFNDAGQLAAHYARVLSETLMPTILRATEASGTSGSATTALLANDAAARVAENAASTGLTAAANYGQIQGQIAGVNANLVNNSAQLQNVAPVAGIQQITPVNPLNPALIQNQQQVQAPNPQGVLVTNDQTTSALTNLTTQSANPVLDALIASLGVSKGAVSNTQTAQSQSSNQVQQNSGTQNQNTTDNKTQQGIQPGTINPLSSSLMYIQGASKTAQPDQNYWLGT